MDIDIDTDIPICIWSNEMNEKEKKPEAVTPNLFPTLPLYVVSYKVDCFFSD